MLDSGFPVDAVWRDIHWIDEYRVLFRGVVLGTYKPGRADGPNYNRGVLVTAHVWDTRRNKVERYGDTQKSLHYFCGLKGYVSYVWQGKLYAGPFGMEQVVPTRSPADSFSERNPQSCKPYAGVSEFDAWRTENKRIAVQLLEEHGWLEVARES